MIGVIFKKEIRDMFRDRRVRNTAFVMPIFIMVLMLGFIGFLQDTITKPSNLGIFVVKGGKTILANQEKALQQAKSAAKDFGLPSDVGSSDDLQVSEVASLAEGRKMIQEGKAHLVLDFVQSITSKQEMVDAYYDPKQESSGVALGAVQTMIDKFNQAATNNALESHHIPLAQAVPLVFSKRMVQVGGKSSAGEMVVSFLPYMIVVWAFYGGMSTATELVAGEKEKSTLETLLISPATRTQIAMGKFLSLCAICFTGSLSAFVGLAVAAALHVSNSMFKGGLGITPESALVTIAVLIPTVALFASILLAISSYAKNSREAQTYLAGVSLVVIMPAMFSQFIGFTNFASSSWLYAVPVLSAATLIRQGLQSQLNVPGMLTCVSISVVLAAIAIHLAVRIFNRESVLVRV